MCAIIIVYGRSKPQQEYGVPEFYVASFTDLDYIATITETASWPNAIDGNYSQWKKGFRALDPYLSAFCSGGWVTESYRISSLWFILLSTSESESCSQTVPLRYSSTLQSDAFVWS